MLKLTYSKQLSRTHLFADNFRVYTLILLAQSILYFVYQFQNDTFPLKSSPFIG